MESELQDAGDKEIIKELVAKTDQMLQERFRLIKAMARNMKAKEDLLVREAELIREIRDSTEIRASNAETRKAELDIMSREDERYQQLITERNDCWHVVKTEEAVIERIHNEIQNLRTVLAL